MYSYIAPATNTIVQSQPPSWMDVVPSTSANYQQQQPTKRYNDVFENMGTFDIGCLTSSSNSPTASSSSNGSYSPIQDQMVFQQIQEPTYYAQQYTQQQTAQYYEYQTVQPVPQPAQFVEHLTAQLHELQANGYPLTGVNGGVTISDTKYTKQSEIWVGEKAEMRSCCRCGTYFRHSENGTTAEGCLHHPKGKRLDKERGVLVRECCQEEDGISEGCVIKKYHVFDQQPEQDLQKFIETPRPRGNYDTRSNQVYAIDCEMVYTVSGPALARLTVVDWDETPVLDCLVKPPTRVIDTSEAFSGLTMKDMERATDTLESCRRKLLSLVNAQTILVGHSLESDLKALRLIHYNVVDTSLLFKSGNFKVGLKKLALEYLGLSIQSNNNNQLGHDSEEDARVSLQLVKYKMCNYY